MTSREPRSKAELFSFLDLLTAQKKLRNKIDILIENNLFVEPKDRNDFLDNVAKALLGTGVEHKIYYTVENGIVPLGYLQQFIGELSYMQQNTIELTFKNKTVKVPIKELWIVIRRSLLELFPIAQKTSYQKSNERETWLGSGAFDYIPQKRDLYKGGY